MQTYSTGAVRYWVAFPGQSPEPFGTAESKPKIRRIRRHADVMNDLAGTELPFDRMYQGRMALVGGVLTRWRESVALRLATEPKYSFTFGIETDVPGDIGTFYGLEGRMVTLFVEYMYGATFAKAVHVAGSMLPGYRFPGAIWEGPDEDELGTGPKKLQFLWWCQRVYDPNTGIFVLADGNMAPILGAPWEIP